MSRAAVVRAAAALGLLALLAAPAAALEPTPAVDLGGTPITASTDPNAPTKLSPGLWSDALGPPDSSTEVHRYSYTRAMKDSTVHIGVVGASVDTADGLQVEAAGADGETCATDAASVGVPNPQLVFGVEVTVGSDDLTDRNSTCLTSPTISFSISRGVSSGVSDLPIAIKVVEEAPIEDAASDLPTTPATPRVARPRTSADGEPITGATSFEKAPELTSGTSYTDSLTEGDVRLYRVRVGWGQQLAVSVDVRKLERGEDDPYISSGVDLLLIDAMRNPFSSEVEDADASGYYGDEKLELFDGSPEVTYLQRFESSVASLPGDYWIALAVETNNDDRDSIEVPVQISVQVEGDVSGAPTYAATVQGPGTGAGPAGYDPATPYLVGDGVFAADPSGNPVAAPPATDDGLASRRVIGIVVGVLSAGLCVAGALRLRRA